MEKVKVQIKPDIAKRGGGFCDISGGQEIMPPRDKNGNPVADQIFTVDRTPFINEKIEMGELIIPGNKKYQRTIEVFVGDTRVSNVVVPVDAPEEEISQLVLMDEHVVKACGDAQISDFIIENDNVVIKVKNAE